MDELAKCDESIGRHDGQHQDEGGEDLNSLLDPSQLSSLTLLIANITESMRQILCQIHDAEYGGDRFNSKRFLSMTNDEKMMVADPSSADIGEYDKQEKLKLRYKQDLNSPQMKGLRQDSLKAYDSWRKSVMRRVSEVIGNGAETEKYLSGLHQTASRSKNRLEPTPSVLGSVHYETTGGTRVRTKDLYPPAKTPLTKLTMERRTLILHSILLLILSLEHYSAYSRVLLLILTSSLKLPLQKLEQDESVTAHGLLQGAKELMIEHKVGRKTDEDQGVNKWKVGIATAAGVAVVGIAGGIAAPLVAAGVNSVMGGLGLGATSAAAYLGSVAGNSYLVGSLFGAYGGRMTGQVMENYAKEVQGFKFIPIRKKLIGQKEHDSSFGKVDGVYHRLRVTICISGWLMDQDGVTEPWDIFGPSAEVFALEYELDTLLSLGNAMSDLVQSTTWGYAQKQLIEKTIFADLATAMWPIGLAKAARVIDNPFTIARVRSEKAGMILADALINKVQGERPVTLIAYSLGARVIYRCLMRLVEKKAFGLVENAILVGAPIPSDANDWRMLRAVVAGRLVNVYSTTDYVLSFMYRTSSLQYGIAGLQEVKGVPGVENVDVSDLITGHLRYQSCIGTVLKRTAIEDLNRSAIETQRIESVKLAAESTVLNDVTSSQARNRPESNINKDGIKEGIEVSLATKALGYFSGGVGQKPAKSVDAATGVKAGSKISPENGNSGFKSSKNADAPAPSIAQMAYRNIPNIPYPQRPAINPSTTDNGSPLKRVVSPEVAAPRPSEMTYVSKAVAYLPSVPSNLGIFSALKRGKPQTNTAPNVVTSEKGGSKDDRSSRLTQSKHGLTSKVENGDQE